MSFHLEIYILSPDVYVVILSVSVYMFIMLGTAVHPFCAIEPHHERAIECCIEVVSRVVRALV